MSLLLSQAFCFLSLTLSFLSLFQFTHSLSTIAISETGNRTLICASIPSSNGQNHLNCTSFPGRKQGPISFLNTSVSGLVAGNGFLCGLSSLTSPRPTSVLACLRASNASHGNISYKTKRIYYGPLLKDLDAGNSHICGVVNETNRLECWQWRRFNSRESEPWNFSSIAVGENFVCGLSELGKIKCLTKQNNEVNSTIAGHEPAGNYNVISAGFHHACAISLNGSLDCWGDMAEAGKGTPDGHFTSLALGDGRTCAMRGNGTVVCWGVGNFSLPESLKATGFIAIEAKRRIFCGIVLSNYSLYCWGNETLDSNPMVFEKVVPGPCTSSCPCSHPLPNYADSCSPGLMVCEPCAGSPSGGSPPLQGTTSRCGGDWTKKNIAFLVVGCVGSTMSLMMIGGYLFCKYCKVRGCRVHDSGPLDDQEANPPPQGGQASNFEAPPPAAAAGGPVLDKRLSHLASIGSGSHLQEYSLEVLHQATNTFSDEHKIGSGSFGSVYHAMLDDGLEVAIKRAEASTSQFHLGNTKRREEDKDNAFVNELEALSRLNHKNLVRLFGYCDENNERILVYEYMKNGTLHDHLYKLKSSPLMSWPNRIKAALDAARGIEYLHVYATPQIIHRDIKSSNILLDATWTAKVSDFGLSLMGPSDEESHLSLKAAGTLGYMDPEYYRLQQLTAKSDVYSFGVVLLELLSGYKAIHQNENGVPRNVVDFVVPYIVQDEIHRVLDRNVPPPTPFEIEAVAYVGYLAADCVMLGGRDRPTMTEIVNNLDRALVACLAAPSPWQSSPSTSGSPA